jgi:adenylosuccinate synthase
MRRAILTVDLGFGDAGKGSVVDFLTREYAAHTVVRYNGGAQAAHRVVTPGPHGVEHVFSQFGSGALAGAATHLSRFMVLDPLAMIEEERHLRALGVPDAFAATTIDAGALIITPFARAINRLRELARGAARHGSCGVGVGETVADALRHGERALRCGDLAAPALVRAKLAWLREVNLAKLRELPLAALTGEQAERELDVLEDPSWIDWLLAGYAEFAARARIVAADYLHRVLDRPGTVVFEGAQGVLLDEWHGFHPHTTWGTTTLANAAHLLAEGRYTGTVTRIGITRAYATRHGAGPLVSEDAALTAALPDARNREHPWQQGFRAGWLDLVLLRYACDVVGPLDGLAVTCLDRLADLPARYAVCRYLDGDHTLARIEPCPLGRSLAYQEQLTGLLTRCSPVLETVADAEALLALLSARLEVPIWLASYGPTAADKRRRGQSGFGRPLAERTPAASPIAG